MPRVINNSERLITLIDVRLVPGVETEVPAELLEHSGVKALFEQKTDKNVPLLEVVGKKKAEPKQEAKAESEKVAKAEEKESEDKPVEAGDKSTAKPAVKPTTKN